MRNSQHQPTDATRAKVEALSAFGIPEEDISREIGVSPPTLRKHYRTELDTGAPRATARVAEFLFNMASGRGGPVVRDKDGTIARDSGGVPIRDIDHRSCTTAAIFWMKARGRWRETASVDLTGIPEGAPPVVVVLPDNGRS
jgi:hypothetical protein